MVAIHNDPSLSLLEHLYWIGEIHRLNPLPTPGMSFGALENRHRSQVEPRLTRHRRPIPLFKAILRDFTFGSEVLPAVSFHFQHDRMIESPPFREADL